MTYINRYSILTVLSICLSRPKPGQLPTDHQEVVGRVDRAVRLALLRRGGVPQQFTWSSVRNGVLTLAVEGEFQVSQSIAPFFLHTPQPPVCTDITYLRTVDYPSTTCIVHLLFIVFTPPAKLYEYLLATSHTQLYLVFIMHISSHLLL